MNPTFASDSDLHGLVDGQIDPERRIQTLRHLAGTPSDRARVECWQTQNDLLQRAFAGVDLEPLPVLLDLKAKPKLQCVPANDSVRPRDVAPPFKVRRYALVGSLLALVIIGAAGAAHYLNWSDAPPEDASVGAMDVAPAAASAQASETSDNQSLPTSRIPDLRQLGFAFVGAAKNQDEPPSIQFTYKGGDESIVLSVARASKGQNADQQAAAPQRIGEAFVWSQGDLVFAVSGSPRAARLRALAIALQDRSDR